MLFRQYTARHADKTLVWFVILQKIALYISSSVSELRIKRDCIFFHFDNNNRTCTVFVQNGLTDL